MVKILNAFIISTGTELMHGATIDTNAVFLSHCLTELGVKVIGRATAGDSEEYIGGAFQAGMDTADIIISSGGLGPTLDDLTKEVVCRLLDKDMILFEEEAFRLRDYFQRRGRAMPENNLKQAWFPEDAKLLTNKSGTASGMCLFNGQQMIALLPGPPMEMELMYKDELEPLLKKLFNIKANPVRRKTIKIFGLGESQVEERIAGLIKKARNYNFALLASEGEVQIKITAEGPDGEHSLNILETITMEIENLLGENIFAYDEKTLVQVVAGLLLEQGKTLALAESCTGGWIAKMITDLPGSSKYFWGSAVTYSNTAKNTILQVPLAVFNDVGAVSPECAQKMAQGVLNASQADLALAVTGIAGPDGGSEEKPVGLVYFALADHQQCIIKDLRFYMGNRTIIRTLAAKTALDIIRRYLKGFPKILEKN